MYTSLSFGGIGSVAISLVPMRVKTRVISGNSFANRVLDFDVGPQGFLYAHPHGFVEHRGNGTLIELRHEFRPEVPEKPQRASKQHDRSVTTIQRSRKAAEMRT